MGQVEVSGPDAPARLESLIPANLEGLAPNRTRYAVLTNDAGGIVDDLLVTRRSDDLLLVLNAARVETDLAWFQDRLPDLHFHYRSENALLALQGPKSSEVIAQVAPEALGLMPFAYAEIAVNGVPCTVSRTGYTGEDGFEIACEGGAAERVADRLLACPEARPAGLGARDSLRLEAGLCLYGSDIDAETSPIEAGLAWTFGPRKNAPLGVPGAARIERELDVGPGRRRVGLRPEGRAVVRGGATIRNLNGNPVGHVTSGTFSPTLGAPIAMGYVAAAHAPHGTALSIDLRGRHVPAAVVSLPFVPHRRRRPSAA